MAVIFKALFVGLLLGSAWELLEGHKSLNSLLFRKIITEYNSKHVSNYEASVSADYSTVNFTLNFVHTITVDVWLRATLAQRVSKKKNSYRNVFTYDVNLCHIMGKGKGQSIINYWLENIMRDSNMPMHCPLKEGNYTMLNIQADKETIPRFIRSGSFSIDSNVYMRQWHNDNLTNTIFYVDIKMK
ncbi:uncharacterized protein LOC117893219 [Drosophila subobscura]|uniref:uncharacterized protein LOC117893219 n=1 Tax=Drosophila subobscura TaxID=7241 RepID=UPI00155B3214|nr:uncharacterized protein LOC117893219 [Drosophila subobscura]